MKKRLAIVVSHPIQYLSPIWRALAKMPELEIHVFFGSDFSVRGYHDSEFGVAVKWDVPLTDGFPHTFLSTDPHIQGVPFRPTGLRQQLRRFKPDVVLLNACLPFFWVEALFIARSLGCPVLLRAEASDVARSRGALKSWVRNLFYRSLHSQFAGCLAIGQNARTHYLSKGVIPDKIGWSPYCVDTDLVSRQIEKYLPQRSRLRSEMGFSDKDIVLVYSGKMIPVKDPMTLVHALQGFGEAQRNDIGLIALGDGELRSRMEVECSKALGKKSIFKGFVNQSQLGQYYAMGDILVLPSLGETWGLVVNEALQFGMPVVISDRVGCGPDLVVQNETGSVFPVGDSNALQTCLINLISKLRNDHKVIGERCRAQVLPYSALIAANGIRSATVACGAKDTQL